MNYLNGKKIIVAVSGSIAAYKTPHLVRLLVKSGAEVKVLMTPAATTLVSPLALSTVSKNPVIQSIANEDNWNNHVALGYWADAILIAPLSANTLAHLANGFCNNIIHAVYLSAKCPILFAPAMDEDMWHHQAVKQNLKQLQALGHHYIPVESGELASGLVGEGRMAEPEQIAGYLNDFFAPRTNSKRTKKAVVTAGPTYEMLDPVRFIGNFSSGKMGIALADALLDNGYEVDLICGPGVIVEDKKYLNIINVVSAQEMYSAALKSFKKADLAIMAAAVADFRPKSQAKEKIKKKTGTEEMAIALIKNPDILAKLGSIKSNKQIVVGFALETEKELENAKSKLKRKQADYIALNSLKKKGAGFGTDTNEIFLINKKEEVTKLPLADKRIIAQQMIKKILEDMQL